MPHLHKFINKDGQEWQQPNNTKAVHLCYRLCVCVCVCVSLSHPVFGSQPVRSTPLARHKTGSQHKRMGGLWGHRSQGRSQDSRHWQGRKLLFQLTGTPSDKSLINLLNFVWSRSDSTSLESIPVTSSLSSCTNALIWPMNKAVSLNSQVIAGQQHNTVKKKYIYIYSNCIDHLLARIVVNGWNLPLWGC